MPLVFAQLEGAAALHVEHYFSFPVPLSMPPVPHLSCRCVMRPAAWEPPEQQMQESPLTSPSVSGAQYLPLQCVNSV